MIHRLVLQNFYSFRNRVEIDLTVSNRLSGNPERLGSIYPGADTRAPKVIAFFGPNAAGKSNILRAFSFIRWFIQESFNRRPEDLLPCFRFNDVSSRDTETIIEIDFAGPVDPTQQKKMEDSCRYSYSLVLGGGKAEQPDKVLRESLFYWPPTASRRVRLFERDHAGKISASRAFGLRGFESALSKILRPNASAISTLVQLGHEPSIFLRNQSGSISSNLFIEKLEYNDVAAEYYASNPAYLAALNNEIRGFDLGIKEVKIQQIPPTSADSTASNVPVFVHDGLASPIYSINESHGTRQFFRIFPFIKYALDIGGVAVIDELDISIHPLILPKILRWFYDPKLNPHDAQLWFTCQNAHLLNELSKEEIFFVEKDETGQTSVFGLRDIKSVRRVDNYVSKYLGGIYGAVPSIG